HDRAGQIGGHHRGGGRSADRRDGAEECRVRDGSRRPRAEPAVTFALTRRTAIASGLAAIAAPAIAIEPPRDITLQQDFDELWETLRDRYAFFEDKATDWDRVRAIYQPRLAEVGDDEDKWNRLLLAVTDEL